MGAKLITVQIEDSEEISSEARAAAQSKACEAALLALWQSGQISTSRAAEELDISIHDFLDLLASHGLAVARGFDAATVDAAVLRCSGRYT